MISSPSTPSCGFPDSFFDVPHLLTTMLLRLALAAVGVVELVWPRRTVDFWMDLAAQDDDVELRSWVYTAARVEGVLILVWVLSTIRRE